MAAKTLVLKNKPTEKPHDDWGTVAVELLGTQTRIVQGERWKHRVIECGEGGEPLLLLHGIGGHAETYARNMHNLAANGFHVFAIDALYHGFTDKEPFTPDDTLGTQADAVADLVRALGFDKVHAEGESMGGMILFRFGLKYPELCGKIVINTGFYQLDLKKPMSEFRENPGGGAALMELSQRSVEKPTYDNIRERMEWLVARPERMTEEMVQIRVRLYAFPEIYESMRKVYRIGSSWPTTPTGTEDDLAAFQPEVLVFWTDDNPGTGPDYGKYCADLMPNATFYSMADAGHWPQWEHPEEHDQVLIEFIKG